MRNDFEACVAHIVPYCPIAKKKTAGAKRGAEEISEVNAGAEEAEISSFGTKSGKGAKTGVHLRYHKGPEYSRLTDDEKDKLWEWQKIQKQSEGKNPKKNRGKKSTDKVIAAAVEKKVEAKMKALADSKTKEVEAEAFIISCLKKYATGRALPPKATSTVTIAPVQAQATFLKSILHRAKNTQP